MNNFPVVFQFNSTGTPAADRSAILEAFFESMGCFGAFKVSLQTLWNIAPSLPALAVHTAMEALRCLFHFELMVVRMLSLSLSLAVDNVDYIPRFAGRFDTRRDLAHV